VRYPGIALLLLISALLAACGGGTEQPAADQPGVTAVADQPTAVLSVEAPTEVPSVGTADSGPITLSGTGRKVTDPISLPWDNTRVTLSHNGNRNFAVTAYQGGAETLLVNVIGGFQGARPLIGAGEVYLDIDADGDWTATIEPLGQADGAAFAGSGPDVSGLFDAPVSGPWEFSHDGSRNFVVHLHCAGTSDLVQNEVGKVAASTEVSFGTAPCFWEVEGDGNWSLAPQ
jgi:hypothetical protein